MEISVGRKAKIKGAPRSKRPGANDGPTRTDYWASGRLARRKVRNLMRHNGLTREQATKLWASARRGRIKKVGSTGALLNAFEG